MTDGDHSWRGRRRFVQAGTLGALGLALPQLLAGRALARTAARAKSVILLWLYGGPSHIDTLDPKPDAPSDVRSPYRAVPTRVHP